MRKLIRQLIKETLLREGQYKKDNIIRINKFLSDKEDVIESFEDEGDMASVLFLSDPTGDLRYSGYIASKLNQMSDDDLDTFVMSFNDSFDTEMVYGFPTKLAMAIEDYHWGIINNIFNSQERDFENMSIERFFSLSKSAKTRISNTQKKKNKGSELRREKSIVEIFSSDKIKIFYANTNSACQYLSQGTRSCIGAKSSIQWYSRSSAYNWGFFFLIGDIDRGFGKSTFRVIVTYDIDTHQIKCVEDMEVPENTDLFMTKDEIIQKLNFWGIDKNDSIDVIRLIEKYGNQLRQTPENFAIKATSAKDIKIADAIADNNVSVRYILSFNPNSLKYFQKSNEVDYSLFKKIWNSQAKNLISDWRNVKNTNFPHDLSSFYFEV